MRAQRPRDSPSGAMNMALELTTGWASRGIKPR